MMKQISNPFLEMSEDELSLFDKISMRTDFGDCQNINPIIKVIGVGGGGTNMVEHIFDISTLNKNIENFIVANTDFHALDRSHVPYKIQLGENTTRGIGSGMVPEKGKEAALESFDDIKEMFKGADIVFIAAGLGGGTGTGAAPIIAQAAKEIGALTVSIVTSPFMFEGRKRTKLAKEGLENLKRESDSIIVIPNEKLLAIVEKNFGVKESFELVDDVFGQAVDAISRIIFSHSNRDIDIDFSDIKKVLSYGGLTSLGTAYSTGLSAAYDAAKMVIESPLLDNISIDGAMGVLIQFDIHPNYPLSGISEAMEIIYDSVNEDADVIFGTTSNENMELDEVSIAIVVTGFEENNTTSKPPVEKQESLNSRNLNTGRKKMVVGGYNGENEDILDVPTFLRKQMD